MYLLDCHLRNVYQVDRTAFRRMRDIDAFIDYEFRIEFDLCRIGYIYPFHSSRKVAFNTAPGPYYSFFLQSLFRPSVA